ncbi:selenide, water dikinase SelD [Tabrizicola fusiformis]|uniref:selenide, water dikinase SelD n=1 Tax=Tabrizicola sp. SY72 TaxID=2741673 RepID=UPI001573BD24|nr:selenide, water dikinase SelD [Tabrizicola sp. SY72]NTT87725.1 selenide, water dikinase SelD [Tabrizicola sp. SY72]
MQGGSVPVIRDVVLIGGGHSHALVARMWGMAPLAGVRLTIVNPGPAAPYTGMLPGLIAGHYARDEIMIDLVRLARFAGARLILDRATGLDLTAGRVMLQGRPPLRFDFASIDIGIGSDLPEVAGYAEHGVAAKPLGAYAEAWEAFVARALPAPRLVIIGGGVGGIELALASAHRLRMAGARPDVTVVDRGGGLPNTGAAARAALLRHVRAAGIALVTGAEALRIGPDRVTLTDGQVLPSDFTLSVAGSRPQGWLAQSGLELHQGFVTVGPTLQSSDPRVFATGDCAHMAHAPRPKAGVFAVRQAPVLYHNLRAVLTEGRLRPYRPQRDYLKLVSTGGQAAVADKFGLRSGGGWLWRIKDRIDRKFMEKFADYPVMPAPALPDPQVAGLAEAMGDKPLCGGCGAKLAPGALAAALAGLPAPARADVLSGRGDDAAVLRWGAAGQGAGVQVMTTDHLRAFTADARLMARIAAVHALGDVWAMGAAPQAALAQVVLPRMAPDLAAAELAEVMEEAAAVFAAAGADVVGGHSSVGAELTIGFTVTGLAGHAVAKGGARPGDALILTKALGTGTVMAAEMAMARLPGLILGEAVAATLAQMGQPQAGAAAVLAPLAHAMTDVTGFGLAAHLLEMLEASGMAARLEAAAVPLLPGALELAAAGVASALAPGNRAVTIGRLVMAEGPLKALLHDPQTAGGLLAAVPPGEAAALLATLRAQGLPAAQIGTVEAGPVRLTVG